MSNKNYGKQTGSCILRETPIPAGGVRLETFVPWTLVKRGVKKQVITPLGAQQEFLGEASREREARATGQDSALMRTLGLANHWQRLLDEGKVRTVGDLAALENMNVTQARRLLRLTLLAPAFVEKLLVDTDESITLESVLRRPMPLHWMEQG